MARRGGTAKEFCRLKRSASPWPWTSAATAAWSPGRGSAGCSSAWTAPRGAANPFRVRARRW